MKILIILFILIVFIRQHRTIATNVTSPPEIDVTTTEPTTEENIEDAISLPLRQNFEDTADQLVLESIISRTRREPPFTIIRHRTKSSKRRSPKPRRKVRGPKPVYGPPSYSSGKPITFYKPKIEFSEPNTGLFKHSHSGGSTKGSYTENAYDFVSDLNLESFPTNTYDMDEVFGESDSNLYDTQSIKFDLKDSTYNYGTHSSDSIHSYYSDTSDFDNHETETGPHKEVTHSYATGPTKEVTHSYKTRPRSSKKPHAVYGVPPPEPPRNHREPSIGTYEVTPNLYETIITSNPNTDYGVPPPEPPRTYGKPSSSYKSRPSTQNYEIPVKHFAEPPESETYEPHIPSKYQPPLQNDFHESDYTPTATFNSNYDKSPLTPSHGSTYNHDFSLDSAYFPTRDDSSGAPSLSGNSYRNTVGHFAEPPLKKNEKPHSKHKIPISHFPLEESNKISHYDSPKTSYEVPIYDPIPFDSGFKGGFQENYPPIAPNNYNHDYTDEDTKGTTKVEVSFPKSNHKNPIKYQTHPSTYLTNDVTQINNLHTLSASLEELTEPPEGLLDQLMSTSSKLPKMKRKRNRPTGPKRHILDADELRNSFIGELNTNPRPSSIVPFDKTANLDVKRRQTTYFSAPPPTERNFVLLSAANNEAPTSVTPSKWEPTKIKTDYIKNSRPRTQSPSQTNKGERKVEVSIEKSHSHSYYGGTVPPEVFRQTHDPVFTQKQTNTRRDFSTIGLRSPGFVGSSYKNGRQFDNAQDFEDETNDDDYSERELEDTSFRPTNHKYKK